MVFAQHSNTTRFRRKKMGWRFPSPASSSAIPINSNRSFAQLLICPQFPILSIITTLTYPRSHPNKHADILRELHPLNKKLRFSWYETTCHSRNTDSILFTKHSSLSNYSYLSSLRTMSILQSTVRKSGIQGAYVPNSIRPRQTSLHILWYSKTAAIHANKPVRRFEALANTDVLFMSFKND